MSGNNKMYCYSDFVTAPVEIRSLEDARRKLDPEDPVIVGIAETFMHGLAEVITVRPQTDNPDNQDFSHMSDGDRIQAIGELIHEMNKRKTELTQEALKEARCPFCGNRAEMAMWIWETGGLRAGSLDRPGEKEAGLRGETRERLECSCDAGHLWYFGDSRCSKGDDPMGQARGRIRMEIGIDGPVVTNYLTRKLFEAAQDQGRMLIVFEHADCVGDSSRSQAWLDGYLRGADVPKSPYMAVYMVDPNMDLREVIAQYVAEYNRVLGELDASCEEIKARMTADIAAIKGMTTLAGVNMGVEYPEGGSRRSHNRVTGASQGNPQGNHYRNSAKT